MISLRPELRPRAGPSHAKPFFPRGLHAFHAGRCRFECTSSIRSNILCAAARFAGIKAKKEGN